MPRDLRALPKAHLHLHLEGAMRPETMDDLCARYGIERPADTRGQIFDDFGGFNAMYQAATRCLRTPDDLAPADDVNGVYYLQDYVAPADGAPRDWRVFVCRDTVIAAMIRHGASWITNMGQGARAEAAEPPAALCDMAVRALAAVGADYGGVDIVADRSGRFLVLEINSMPAWSALERVTAAGVAEHLVAAFLDSAGLA